MTTNNTNTIRLHRVFKAPPESLPGLSAADLRFEMMNLAREERVTTTRTEIRERYLIPRMNTDLIRVIRG